MGKYKDLAKNTVYVSIGTIGSKIIGIIMLPLYTRWLSVEEFGTVDAITIYSTLLLCLISMCISESIFVFPKNQPNTIQGCYYSSGIAFCLLQFVLGFVLVLLINFISNFIKPQSIFISYSWFIYLLLVSSLIQAYTQSFTRSLNKMLVYSTMGIIQTICISLFSFILIPKLGVRGYVFAFIIANLISSVFAFIVAKHRNYFSLKRIEKKYIKSMLKYSIPLIPNNIMWWLINGFNRPIMEIYLSLFSLGIYAVANKFSTILQSVFSIFGMSWFNSALDEYGKPGFEKFYNNCIKMISTFLFLSAYIIIILSEKLVQFLTTEDYYIAYKYIPFLLLSIVFSCLSGVIGCIFACVKKSVYYFYSSFFGGISSLLSLFLLTPIYGLYGVALSVLISHTLMLFFTMRFSFKYVEVKNLKHYIFLLLIYFSISLNTLFENQYSDFVNILSFSLFILISKKDIAALIGLIKLHFLNKI